MWAAASAPRRATATRCAAAVAAAWAFDETYNYTGWIFPDVEENESSSRPTRVKSRAPKSLSREQMDMPVFSPDLFGDGEGLVFPSSSSDGDDDATAPPAPAPARCSNRSTRRVWNAWVEKQKNNAVSRTVWHCMLLQTTFKV